MECVVNPGPIDPTLLLSQHEHKSKLLWKCEISFSSLMRAVHMIPGIYFICIDLIDVLRRSYVLFGLLFDGDVVYMQDAARRIRPWRTLLETLTGCTIAPTNMDIGKSGEDT
ncbi:hypothetical protein KY290_017404 [Solanum tuberosum]|uniref:Uncharacterized protein n=1 Tax=Solanum tuberosum TaxID=4113 RepID=A0ABQ7VD45_SOLTU|nr:hypothetical protein KY290_017404 [Solanum tuberosum]